MQFPTYQVPFAGNGMIIGLNAIVHVLISHGLAIGGFAIVVFADWCERRALPEHKTAWQRFARRLLKVTVLTVTIAGAVTGAGIWFTTSALAPRAIGSMLRVFFWTWFAEWIVFVAEVIALLVYYRQWARLEARRRLRIGLGLAYLCLALASAVLITGNLGFMLTPDGWPEGHRFWPAFLNPTFLPQLVTRIAFSFALGAGAAMVVLLRGPEGDGFKRTALRPLGGILLLAVLILVPALWAYVAAVPRAYLQTAPFSVLTGRLSQSPDLFYLWNALAAALVLVLVATALAGRVRASGWMILPGLLAIAGIVGEFERIREFIRGPYLIPGYMFANTVLMEEKPLLDQEGLRAHSYWYKATYARDSETARGAYLFAENCAACHTIGGANDIGRQVAGRSEDGLFVILRHTHEMVPFMPPFSGTTTERHELARFLYQLAEGDITMESYSRLIPRERGPHHE